MLKKPELGCFLYCCGNFLAQLFFGCPISCCLGMLSRGPVRHTLPRAIRVCTTSAPGLAPRGDADVLVCLLLPVACRFARKLASMGRSGKTSAFTFSDTSVLFVKSSVRFKMRKTRVA